MVQSSHGTQVWSCIFITFSSTFSLQGVSDLIELKGHRRASYPSPVDSRQFIQDYMSTQNVRVNTHLFFNTYLGMPIMIWYFISTFQSNGTHRCKLPKLRWMKASVHSSRLLACCWARGHRMKASVLFLATASSHTTVGSEHRGLAIHPHTICRGMRRVENTSIWKIKLSAWNNSNNNTSDGPLRWVFIYLYIYIDNYFATPSSSPLSTGAVCKGLGSLGPAATSHRGGLNVSASAVRHPQLRWNSRLRSGFRSELCFYTWTRVEGAGRVHKDVRAWGHEFRVSCWFSLLLKSAAITLLLLLLLIGVKTDRKPDWNK